MDRAAICCILSKVRLNGISKNGAMAQLVAHLHGMEGVGVRIPLAPQILNVTSHEVAFFVIIFDFYAPRRIFYCLSASRTNNEHHRPEVALDKSNKHELGKR